MAFKRSGVRLPLPPPNFFIIRHIMKNITRRDIVAAIGTAGAGVCVCGMNSGCSTFSKVGDTPPVAADAYTMDKKSVRIALDKVSELGQVGGAVKIIDKRLPASLIVGRTGEGEYVAVSLLCPHRGVEVEYKHEDKQFRCASLGHSKFGTDGKIKKGLTKKSLSCYTAAVDPVDEKVLVVTL